MDLEKKFENSEIIEQERDYRQEMFDKYENYIIDERIDDSWIEDEDKIKLINACKETVNTHYSQFPSPMNEVLVEKFYSDTIKNMNKDEYFREKEELKSKSVLEIELSKIDPLSEIKNKLYEM